MKEFITRTRHWNFDGFSSISPHRLAAFFLGIITVLPLTLCAGGVAEFQKQKVLTPEGFIRQFSDFKFELADEIQEPDRFLERRRGDCDDFARLASQVLTARGYKTKIVVVLMDRETHVVCYVAEAKGFLDFNHRADAKPIVESDGSLEDIAQKVSAEFRSKWRMVSEVRYEKATPVYVENVFYYASTPAPERTENPKPAPASAPIPAPEKKVAPATTVTASATKHSDVAKPPAPAIPAPTP